MQVITFWKIVLKTIGLWLVVNCIYTLQELFLALVILSQHRLEGRTSFTVAVASIVILGGAAYCFIFQDNWLIDKLQLTKAFPEQYINISTPAANILKIIVIVLGGWIFLESVPGLIRTLAYALLNPNSVNNRELTTFVVYNLLRAGASFWAMTNSPIIVKWITKKSEEPL
jgi:hypothetical protein